MTYLGESPLPPTSKYHDYSPTDWAMEFISSYGQIDGAHHKNWVLDQVARILHGTPVISSMRRWDNGQEEITFSTGPASLEYLMWVAEMQGPWDHNEDGFEYEYDIGIAP